MHIVVVNQFYWPSIAATAQIVTDLCEHWASEGHRVSVVSSRSDYLGGDAVTQRRETRNGVAIIRLPATSFGKASKLHRMMDYGTYYAGVLPTLLSMARPDVILSMSTPPLIALPALAAARARKARFVYWCLDIYPDIAVALGVLPDGGALSTSLELATRLLLKQSDAVVTLGHGMKARLQQKANCDPIVIATWADGQTIRPRVEAHADLDTEFARSAGIHADELVVMYSGNMGMAHDFAALIGLWRTERPEGQRPLHFVMVGDGAQKPALEAAAELARSRGWRITFLPYQPREALGQSLPTADVHLIVLDERAQDLVFPSKLHGVLAAGRPTLLLGPPASELARILRDGECGIAVRSDDVPGLADALAGWSDDPAPLQGMGERARTLFDSHYDRQVCCDQFTRVVDGLSRSAPL